jgi:hypothetical protein
MKRTALYFCLLAIGASPAFAQKFWSPREVTLDSYERPVPFRLGDATCLAYELHITNMDSYPISVKRIEVNFRGSDTPFKVYADELLKKSLSRIRVPGGIEADDIVNPGQRAILHVLLSFQNKDEVPEELLHKVVYSFVQEDGAEVETTSRGGVVTVAVDSGPVIIGAPLGEGVWMAGNGVEDGFSGHRRGAIRPRNGIPYQKARYAFDFTRLDEEGRMVRGDKSENTSWLAYGSEVIAVADARVEFVQDGIPDSRPFDPDKLNGLTGSTLAGNYVVLDLGDDLYALYGHLKPGSIPVQKGDAVKKGQIIGLVGNSGNSDLPHLHFQINRHTPIRGEAVPYVFERYEYLGESDLAGLSSSVYMDMINHRITDRVTGGRMEKRQIEGDADVLVETSIANVISDNILESRKAGSTPDLNREGEVHTFEMPVSGSLVRFEKSHASPR